MAKRFFVQLAHKYNPEKNNVGGWLMSEKLDGMRSYWDGGVSRGIPCSETPWANTLKDHIRKDPPIATGLWTRRGKMIPAPDWYLDKLPDYPLDGELYLGPGNFQKVMSTCKGADRDWEKVKYCVYGMPSLKSQFSPGEICFNSTQKINVDNECIDFFVKHSGKSFKQSYEGYRLVDMPEHENEVWYTLDQERLPLYKSKYTQINENERVLYNAEGTVTNIEQWKPGKSVSSSIESKNFPIGSEVRFKYRELTDDGKPKEARYWR